MHASTQRVLTAAHQHGLELEIVTFAQPTRTAVQAAEAVGCAVAQIVKSLCFVVAGQPTIIFVSGANQLDVKKLAALCGVGKKQVKRAEAETVKAATGYSIGGVSPFGWAQALPTYLDRDLLAFEVVWAAAGTPHTVFPIAPQVLAAVTGAMTAEVRRDNG